MSPKEGFQYGVVDGPGLPLLEENLKRYKGLKVHRAQSAILA